MHCLERAGLQRRADDANCFRSAPVASAHAYRRRTSQRPNVRLLAQILKDAGYDDTAQKDAIRLQALEAPLSVVDHEAILTSLGIYCPTGLARLRRELLEDMRRRRAGL